MISFIGIAIVATADLNRRDCSFEILLLFMTTTTTKSLLHHTVISSRSLIWRFDGPRDKRLAPGRETSGTLATSGHNSRSAPGIRFITRVSNILHHQAQSVVLYVRKYAPAGEVPNAFLP